MGDFFASFEEAWAFFLERAEPLEDFFETLPEAEAYLTAWLALPGEVATAEASAVQEGLEGIGGLRLSPAHFLHVALGSHEAQLEVARERLSGFGSFDAEYGPVNCFHDAVFLEVRSDQIAGLALALEPERDLEYFLPHLSLGYFEGGPSPEPIRDALVGLRDREPVTETISEVHLCVVPVARSEILSPWSAAGVVPLD
jgi:hypothetical protein